MEDNRVLCQSLGRPIQRPDKGTWFLDELRDFFAGLIVAPTALPLAIVSGLKPETGIVGEAVGAVLGGSKYQVDPRPPWKT